LRFRYSRQAGDWLFYLNDFCKEGTFMKAATVPELKTTNPINVQI